MCIHNHEQRAERAHPESDETSFPNGIRILTRQCVLIVEYRCSIGKPDTVSRQIRLGFRRIPLDIRRKVYGQSSSSSMTG